MGIALFLAGVLGACAAQARPVATPAVHARSPVVHELGTLADLEASFDRDQEHPRLVLLLSPT